MASYLAFAASFDDSIEGVFNTEPLLADPIKQAKDKVLNGSYEAYVVVKNQSVYHSRRNDDMSQADVTR